MKEKSLGEILFNNQKKLENEREIKDKKLEEELAKQAKVDLDKILVLVEKKIKDGDTSLMFSFNGFRAHQHEYFLNRWCNERSLSFETGECGGRFFTADGGLVNTDDIGYREYLSFSPKNTRNRSYNPIDLDSPLPKSKFWSLISATVLYLRGLRLRGIF